MICFCLCRGIFFLAFFTQESNWKNSGLHSKHHLLESVWITFITHITDKDVFFGVTCGEPTRQWCGADVVGRDRLCFLYRKKRREGKSRDRRRGRKKVSVDQFFFKLSFYANSSLIDLIILKLFVRKQARRGETKAVLAVETWVCCESHY